MSQFDTRKVAFVVVGFVFFGFVCFGFGIDFGRSFPDFPSFGDFFAANAPVSESSVEQARVASAADLSQVVGHELVEEVKVLIGHRQVPDMVNNVPTVANVVLDAPNVRADENVLVRQYGPEVANNGAVVIDRVVEKVAEVAPVHEVVGLVLVSKGVLHRGVISV